MENVKLVVPKNYPKPAMQITENFINECKNLPHFKEMNPIDVYIYLGKKRSLLQWNQTLKRLTFTKKDGADIVIEAGDWLIFGKSNKIEDVFSKEDFKENFKVVA